MTLARSTLFGMTQTRTFDALLGAVAAARLSRVATTDDAGLLVRVPAQRWAARHEHGDQGIDNWGAVGWRTHLVGGLECPFCVGFWLGAGVVVSYAAVRDTPRALAVWRIIAGSLALNYVVGHVSSRID